MEAQWNTKRFYSEEGQIIKAKVMPDGSVLFADKSRGIDGHITAEPLYGLDSAEELRRHVMHHYDYNTYESDRESREYSWTD